MWGTLLYSHTAAIVDPLGSWPSTWRPGEPTRVTGPRPTNEREASQDRSYALHVLHFLAAVAPLVDAGTLVLVPDDRLPQVALNFGSLLASMQGLRAALIENARYEGEFHPEWPAKSYIGQLEQLARTSWSIHIPPLSASDEAESFALRALLRRGRRRLWRERLRRVTLGRFDTFAIDMLTEVPVDELTDLASRDIQLIRDEGAFGSWRAELSAVMAEYERNVGAAVPDAARIATERLERRAEQIGAIVGASPTLSAMRAGLGTFAIAGSAVLAAFPVLSVSGRADGASLAAGSSLVAAGRRLVFHARHRTSRPLAMSRLQHVRSARAIFRARSSPAHR